MQRWRIAAFSTGEIDLESFLKSKGIQINAGQLVRLLNVPISPAKCFHGLPDGKAHADHLNAAIVHPFIDQEQHRTTLKARYSKA